MKKVCAILSIIVILFTFPMISYADNSGATGETDSCVKYYSDGSYTVTTIETSDLSHLDTSTIKKTKHTTFYNSDNEKEWDITVTGTFTYTGSSATCTNSTVSYKIYDTHWKVTSSQASKSGRIAKGEFTLKRYFLGIPIKTDNETLTITCSNTGVCS